MSAPTPGQLAYEAYERACAGDPRFVPFPWEKVDRRGRKNWEAAAKAANRDILERHDRYGSALEMIIEADSKYGDYAIGVARQALNREQE